METFTGLPVQELENMGGRNSTALMQTSFLGLIRRAGPQCSRGQELLLAALFLGNKRMYLLILILMAVIVVS